jgi:Right handed beta helix region
VKQEIIMRRIALLALVIAFSTSFLEAALAQNGRSWVSGLGDDSANCQRLTPCKTFAAAQPKTVNGGEINCADSAGFGTITITQSLTIDCQDVHGSVLAAGTPGIIVNALGITVNLRNLNIIGAGNGTIGISIVNAGRINVENVTVEGFTQEGLYDSRAGFGGMLTLKNTTVRNNAGAGVKTFAAGQSGTVLENVHLVSNLYGVHVGNGNNTIINRSVLATNGTAGIQADTGSKVVVDSTMIDHNTYGIKAQGTVQLTNSDIAFNGIGISGATSSYGNNRIFGNASGAGTAPSVGAVSSDHGQQ